MALIRQAGTFTDRFGNDVVIATGDNADTFLGTGDDYVAVSNARSLTGASIVYAIGRTIRVQSGGALRQHPTANNSSLAGRHIYFINCNIIFEAGSSLGPDVGSDAARSFTGHVGDGQAATTSINFVGCDVSFTSSSGTLQTVSTDWIDSNLRVTNQFVNVYVVNRNPGSRTENTLFETVAFTGNQEWNFYGNPETLSDVVLSGFRLRTGSGAGDQTVLAPNLLFGNISADVPNLYSFNAGSGANPGFHHPGFTFIATAAAPDSLVDRANGQFTGNTFVVNHYGYDPTFYDSGLLTADSLVEGARIRMTSNANIVNRTGTNVAGSIVASAKSQTTINEFLTNAQGRMVSNQYSINGGTTFNPGYFDYTQSLNTATAGATSFGATQAGQSVADGVGIFPLQVWRAGTGFDTTNNVEVRSYSHDINIDNDISMSDYAVGDFIPIDTNNVVGANLIGTRVKTTNVDAANQPDISFDGTQTASLQDFGNIARAAWAAYSFEPVFDGGQERPSAGPFDERDYPIRVRVSTSPAASGDFYTGTGFAVQFNSGQLRISVNCAGVAPDLVNDSPGNDPRTTSFNNGNQPLDLGGQLLETMGGCTNLRTLANGEINNLGTSGAIAFQAINNGTAAPNLETRLTGVVTLNNQGGGGIDNLPPILGRADGSDTITLENSVSQATGADRTAGGVTYSSPAGNGLYSPSTWTGVTTLSAFDYGEVRTITFNGGCNLEGTVSIQASEDSIWRFNEVLDTLDLNIPATQSNLVRIDTGVDAQNTDLDRYNQVRAWLVSKLGETAGVIPGVNEERTAAAGGTEPTTGYWLVRPPAVAATPVVLKPFGVIENDNTSADWTGSINQQGGTFAYKVVGAALNTAVIHNITATSTLADLSIPNTNNEQNVNYFYYYKPANVFGANRVSYRPVTGIWNPSVNGNFDIGTILDPALLVSAGTSTITSFTTSYASNVVTVLLTGFTSTDTPSAGDSVSLALALGNDSDVINAILDGEIVYSATNRLWDFGNESSVTYNVGTGNVMRIQTGDANQQQLPNASGFATNTAAVSVPTVGDPQVNQLLGTDQQIEEIAGGTGAITELGNELKSNQAKLSTDVRLASQLRPASGTIPNTAD